MAERAEELRSDIEARRAEIGRTVDQIENRVSPSRMAARGRYRFRRRLTDWKDSIMGNDEPDYPFYPATGPVPEYWDAYAPYSGVEPYRTANGGDEGGLRQRASGAAADMGHRAEHLAHEAGHLPEMTRRQARGNPMAAGVIAFGAGLLLGSILPETRRERRMVRDLEPQLERAAHDARDVAEEVAEDLREPAQQAVERTRAKAQESAQHLKDDGTETARRSAREVREDVRQS